MNAHDDAPTGILGEASRDDASAGNTPQPPVDPHAATLEDVGHVARYQVRTLLGEGGMGEVRLCRDRRVGREVAMKVIRSDQNDRPEVRARFLREARVQGQLEHPAIVPVYDIGFGDDGASHFTMKRVRGSTLAQCIEALRLADPEAAERYSRRRLLAAFGTVCQAVHYAHSRGVVHRDLKPDNVMLGAYGEVYVLDWGVARLVGVADPAEPQVQCLTGPLGQTQHGAVIGTPGYMAPEQLRGETESVSPRSDVYALGAILFELLTLHPLHPRDPVEATVASTLQGADARASLRAPEGSIAPELDAICVRATALDPAARFPSALDLFEAVEAYLDGDRDVALRRSLADAHASRAETLAAEALAGAPAALTARRTAMQEVGRALALCPEHPAALRTMLRLLVEPPAEMPAEANETLAADEVMQTRAGLHAGGVAYLTWLVLAPLVLWMGVREWTSLASLVGLLVSASVVCFAVARQERPSLTAQHLAMIAGNLAALSTLRMFGPWVLVPCIVTANALLFALSPAAGRYRSSTLIACVSIATGALLEHFDAFDAATVFVGGTLQIRPRMVHLPPTATFVFLLVTHLGVVITTTALMDRFRRTLLDAQRRLHLHAWQLRALVPPELRDAAREGPPTRLETPGCSLS